MHTNIAAKYLQVTTPSSQPFRPIISLVRSYSHITLTSNIITSHNGLVSSLLNQRLGNMLKGEKAEKTEKLKTENLTIIILS